MRGKKAKALRRKVYGDISPRAREYRSEHQSKAKSGETRVAIGFRRVYQDAKRHG